MNKENSKGEQMADFRYSVVADLANPYLEAAKRRQLIREKADRIWDIPGIGRKRLSEGCILKWLSMYRKYGKAGLEPKRRRDAGQCRALSPVEAALFLNYLETHPEAHRLVGDRQTSNRRQNPQHPIQFFGFPSGSLGGTGPTAQIATSRAAAESEV